MTLKAVIFDFDGVILESAHIKTTAFLDLFRDRPEHLDAIREHHLQNMGVSRYEKFRWIYDELFEEPLSETACSELGQQFQDLVLEAVLDCPFVPGALSSLRTLAAMVPLFVASGTPQEELELVIQKRSLSSYFEEVWGSPTPKARIISSILDRWGLLPVEVAMIGDGESDYLAAKETGVQFLGRATTEQPDLWSRLDVPHARDLSGLPARLGLLGQGTAQPTRNTINSTALRSHLS